MKLHQSILNDRRREICAPTSAGRRTLILLTAVLAGFSSTHAQTNYQRLLSFSLSEFSAGYPNSPLIEGSDSAFYGTTRDGGASFGGTVFRVRKDGSGFTVLHSFSPTAGDGSSPRATVLEGSDGVLYGTVQQGNDSHGTLPATVYKLNRDGSAYKVLHHFTGQGDDEFLSETSLVEGSDGALYGTTYGSTNNSGTVFKLNKDGSGYSVLHTFPNGHAADGSSPVTGVLAARDGALYGTTYGGGAYDSGTLFKLNIDGSGYAVLHSFNPDIGEGSSATGLVQGRDGALYGTITGSEGSTPAAVFKLNEDGSGYAVLHRFVATNSLVQQNLRPAFGPQLDVLSLMQGSDGTLYGMITKNYWSDRATIFKLNSDGSGYTVLDTLMGAAYGILRLPPTLVEGSDGGLYGTTRFGGKHSSGTMFKLNKDGSGYSVVRDFLIDSGNALGGQSSGVLAGKDGALYGATYGGGTNASGTVFKVNQNGGGYEIMHHFGGRDEDGDHPAGLVEGSDGALYGTTWMAGTNDAGTVFKLSKDGGGYTVLRRLTGDVGEEVFPVGRLVEGSDGALYGTTAIGHNYEIKSGTTVSFGTIFKLNKDGSDYSVLHSFDGPARDGSGPQAGLLKGSDEMLYGTTTGGNDRGTVFKLNQDGGGYRVLHVFNGVDGRYLYRALVEGRDGMLYGTTEQGGVYDWGTVFKMSKDGSNFSLLHSFPHSGGYPSGGIVEGRDGVLYGTTYDDGGHEFGTVFSLNEDGTGFTILYRFTGQGGDNAGSSADLAIGIDGTLYGTTTQGGDLGQGTVFKLFYSPPRIVITRIELGGTGARLSWSGGTVAQTYQIQATTNLRLPLWQTIGSQSAAASVMRQFLDSDANNYPARFYRVIAP